MNENTPITLKPISEKCYQEIEGLLDEKHKIRGLHKDVRVYRSPKRKYKEDIEQINFVSWLRFNHPQIADRCFHVPNESASQPQYRAKLNKMGLNSGIPDLMFYGLPLMIEMKKTIGGSLSKEQKEKLNMAAEDGAFSCVCFGAEGAKLAIADFLK